MKRIMLVLLIALFTMSCSKSDDGFNKIKFIESCMGVYTVDLVRGETEVIENVQMEFVAHKEGGQIATVVVKIDHFDLEESYSCQVLNEYLVRIAGTIQLFPDGTIEGFIFIKNIQYDIVRR